MCTSDLPMSLSLPSAQPTSIPITSAIPETASSIPHTPSRPKNKSTSQLYPHPPSPQPKHKLTHLPNTLSRLAPREPKTPARACVPCASGRNAKALNVPPAASRAEMSGPRVLLFVDWIHACAGHVFFLLFSRLVCWC
ncbi:hypothetical protein BDU57DRAFT_167778 [Ampelomyces quisqualis]|uniref:Uncharacterized protein n=1 Tax=Ampelomyces quisqualis TaxID=50730 RepID=A0A6A5QS79_AMPQU|nr:hypothetical protein BDU57DRAFT_167778 [Ampelomyces quisqualis]